MSEDIIIVAAFTDYADRRLKTALKKRRTDGLCLRLIPKREVRARYYAVSRRALIDLPETRDLRIKEQLTIDDFEWVIDDSPRSSVRTNYSLSLLKT